MDNELDGRLRRLEAGLEGQRTLLEHQAGRQEQIHELVREALAFITQPEPEGVGAAELDRECRDGQR